MNNKNFKTTWLKLFLVLTAPFSVMATIGCGDASTIIPPALEMEPGVLYGNLNKVNVKVALESSDPGESTFFFECQQTKINNIFDSKRKKNKEVAVRFSNKDGKTIGKYKNTLKKWKKSGESSSLVFSNFENLTKAIKQLEGSGIFVRLPECKAQLKNDWTEAVKFLK